MSASACTSARAASAPAGPPLDVPTAPPRVLVPIEEVAAAESEPPADAPADAAPAPPRSAPRPAAEAPAQPAPPPVETTPPPTAGETRELRPAPSGNAPTEQAVRDLVARASQALGRVNYGRLTPEGRATYDQARRFNQQAEQALRERNVVFAHALAERAAALSADLLGR